MTPRTEAVTPAVLQAFADVWNRHDVDALMSFMTEDRVFDASAGPSISGTQKQFEPTVIRRRWIARCAAAQLRR